MTGTGAPNIFGFSLPLTASIASRIVSASRRRDVHAAEQPVVGVDAILFRRRAPTTAGTRSEVRMSRCSFFRLQPCATNSLASQSSSSGCVGRSPRCPKSPSDADDAAAEMMMPDAVDEHARGERVLAVGEALREREPAAAGRRAPADFSGIALGWKDASTVSSPGCTLSLRLHRVAALEEERGRQRFAPATSVSTGMNSSTGLRLRISAACSVNFFSSASCFVPVGAVVEVQRAAAELVDRRVLLQQLELLGRALFHLGAIGGAQRLAHFLGLFRPAPTSSTFSMNSSSFTLRCVVDRPSPPSRLPRPSRAPRRSSAKRAAPAGARQLLGSNAGSKIARSR